MKLIESRWKSWNDKRQVFKSVTIWYDQPVHSWIIHKSHALSLQPCDSVFPTPNKRRTGNICFCTTEHYDIY